MSKELAVYEPHDLGVVRPPEQVLTEAREAARALADIISKKKKPIIIGGEQYLEFEDWQTVGRFYGVTAKIVSTEYIRYGEVEGFQARAVALRADGMETSAAEAMCLNDEDNWKSRPLFQLRSMAQTRACAKALRNVLAWVVVLAGYRATPAEEMQDMAQDKSPIIPPQAKKQTQTPDAEGNITIKAVIEKTSSKEGKKGNKIWTLYGILADGVWYNTFSKTLYDIATLKTGKEVEIVYQASEKGNNLVSIRFEGCTGSPSTCNLSSYENETAICEGGTVCMFQVQTESKTEDKKDTT